MKIAYYVIIIISVVSKLTATYVEPSEELARITKQGHTKLTKRNEAITNNSGGAFERLPQENKEKIFNLKYERGRRVPIFECLSSGKNIRKLGIPSFVENLYGNRTNFFLSNETMVQPQNDIHSTLSKEKSIYGTSHQIRNQLMAANSMRILNEINLDDHPQILIITSSRPPLSSSNPLTDSPENLTDIPQHIISSFKQLGNSSQLLNSSSQHHIHSPQHLTSNNFRTSQKPLVKHKVTPSYFRNVVYPKYDEEPEIKSVEIVSNNSFEDKSNRFNNVLVISAPKNLGGLPVVVVHNKNNNTVSLSLKKNSNRITFKKYHPQINEEKEIEEYNQPDKTGDLYNSNTYISPERQKIVPHLLVPNVVPHLSIPKVVPHLSIPKVEPHLSIHKVEPHLLIPKVVPHLSIPKVVPHLSIPKVVPHLSIPKVVPHFPIPKVVPHHLSIPKVVPHLSIPKFVPHMNRYLTDLAFEPPVNHSRHSKMTNIQREINRQLVNNLINMMKKKIISEQ